MSGQSNSLRAFKKIMELSSHEDVPNAPTAEELEEKYGEFFQDIDVGKIDQDIFTIRSISVAFAALDTFFVRDFSSLINTGKCTRVLDPQ